MSDTQPITAMKIEGDSRNPMMTQRVRLEMDFWQVFGLCFKVVLAQLLLLPLLALGMALVSMFVLWFLRVM